MHKKVQVVIIHKSTNQLLLLRTKVSSGHFWQNVTGSVEGEESFEVAAIRELKEETCLEGNIINLKLETEFKDKWDRQVLEKCFLALVENLEIKISDEHDSFKWINLKEVTKENYKYEWNYEVFLEALKCL